MKEATPTNISTFPGYLIRRCNQIAMAIFIEETMGYDLTPAQFGALSVIHSHPRLDQTDLMERLALDRSSVTRCVDRLEARGLIERLADPHDRRMRRLAMTPSGDALFSAAASKVLASQCRLLEPLGEERAKLLVELLAELATVYNHLSRAPIRETGEA